MADRAREAALKAVNISIGFAREDVRRCKAWQERMPFDHTNNDSLPEREEWLKDLESAATWLTASKPVTSDIHMLIDSYDVRAAMEKLIASGVKPSTVRSTTATQADMDWFRERLVSVGWHDVIVIY